MLPCPCNVNPIAPHFYIVKLGFTGVYIVSDFCHEITCDICYLQEKRGKVKFYQLFKSQQSFLQRIIAAKFCRESCCFSPKHADSLQFAKSEKFVVLFFMLTARLMSYAELCYKVYMSCINWKINKIPNFG